MKVKVDQSCPTLCDPMDFKWNPPGQHTGVGSLSLLQGNLPNPGIEPRSPTLWADSLPAEPPEKPTFLARNFLGKFQTINNLFLGGISYNCLTGV